MDDQRRPDDFTVDEAAEYLRISARQVRRLISRQHGEPALPSFMLNRRRRIAGADLRSYYTAHMVTPEVAE